MIALNQVVPPFSVDMPNAVKMRIISMVDLADDAPIGVGRVGYNRYRSVQPHALDRPAQEGFGSLCIPPRSQSEVHHLTICIDCPPQIPPLTANTDVGLVGVPIDAGSAQMFLRSLGQFRAEFLHPAVHGRPINRDVALRQKINDVLIGQRIAQVSTHGAKNESTREAMMFER